MKALLEELLEHLKNSDTVAKANHFLLERGWVLRRIQPMDPIRPPYVTVGPGGTAMERTRGGYWREWGAWGVQDGFVDGKHVVIGGYFIEDERDSYFWDEAKGDWRFYNEEIKHWEKDSHCMGVELIPITREEFVGDGGDDGPNRQRGD